MPYSRQVVKVRILGDCFNSAEEWSTGFYVAPGFGNPVLPGNYAEQVAGLWQTFFTAASTSVSSRYRTISVKANIFDTNNVQITNPTQEYFYPAPIVGPSAGAPLPPQLTVVASLRTSVPRGIGSHGRMYLPGINQTVDSDARINATAVGNIATNFKAFLDGVNALPNTPILSVHLFSSANLVGKTPVDRYVTQLKIGNMYDTQRRRRNQLTETYTDRVVVS